MIRRTPRILVLVFACAISCATEQKPAASAPEVTVEVKSAAGSTGGETAAIAKVHVDRSALTDVGTSAALDYGDPNLWLCRPGNDPDECDRNLDATELLPDGQRTLVPHVKAENPEFDCFYVYPTVKLDSAGPMTNFANTDIVLDPLLSQAARFNRVCRMYAPLYRQNGIIPGTETSSKPTDFALGANDIRGAFKYYLEHLNRGRKFVLLGHSQGTGMLMQLLAQDIDAVPAVRDRMLSALLIGGNFMVAEGSDKGGTLSNIPICKTPGQTGCVIAYESYSKEMPPVAKARFGKAMPGKRAACTDPAALAGNSGRYKGSYVRLKRVNATFAPDGIDKLPADITTPFLIYRNVIRGNCKSAVGFDYLEIASEMDARDPRPAVPYRNTRIESAGLGLHIVDYNLELDDLIDAVTLQAKAAR